MTEWPVVLAIVLVLTHPAGAHENSASQAPAGASPVAETGRLGPRQDGLGLHAFPGMLAWLARLPSAFDQFVASERREQLIRRMRGVAKAYADVNVDCLTLAALLERGTTKTGQDFDTLVESLRELRQELLWLATDLGGEWGAEGSHLAFELARLTAARGGLTDAARAEMMRGLAADGAKRLREAAELAERAQKMVIEFLQTVAKK